MLRFKRPEVRSALGELPGSLPDAFPQLVLRIGLLLSLYVLAERVLVRISRLPEESYGRAYLLGELIKSLFVLGPIQIFAQALVVTLLVLCVRLRSLGPPWSAFDLGAALRALIVLVAFVLAWAYGTEDYNLYFDQAHDFDRLFLLALVPLLFWRPVFVFPFLLILLSILQQFDLPIGGYSWAEPILLARVLVLFGVFFLVGLWSGHWRTDDFVFLLCCLIAGHYWVCGYGKLQLDWIAIDRIHYLLPATYANGWLGFLQPETIGRLTRGLAWANWPLKLLTLTLECGALVCLWRRTWLRFFLISWITFHLGTFLVTGICFWKWMVLEAGLLMFFFRKNLPLVPIFTREHFLFSLILIAGAALWFGPTKLAWLDARVSYTYRFEAQTDDGRICTLPPRFFAPYDYQFTLSNFGYLTDEPHLGIVWGATMQPALASALEQIISPEQVWALESNRNHRTFHPRRSAAFDRFIQRTVESWNKRGSKHGWWRLLRAPRQLWTFARPPAITDGQRVNLILVYQVTSLFDGSHYREIRKREVRRIHVDPHPAEGN